MFAACQKIKNNILIIICTRLEWKWLQTCAQPPPNISTCRAKVSFLILQQEQNKMRWKLRAHEIINNLFCGYSDYHLCFCWFHLDFFSASPEFECDSCLFVILIISQEHCEQPLMYHNKSEPSGDYRRNEQIHKSGSRWEIARGCSRNTAK